MTPLADASDILTLVPRLRSQSAPIRSAPFVFFDRPTVRHPLNNPEDVRRFDDAARFESGMGVRLGFGVLSVVFPGRRPGLQALEEGS
jgi:hypothetical protein